MTIGRLMLLCAFILIASAFSFKKTGGEDRGKGLTDQEANFIKARVIEASKQTKDIESIGDMLQPIISAGLGNVWGVFIWDLEMNCNMVIRPGDPLDDKWIVVN